MGRPPKNEEDKHKRRVSMPLTESNYQDLLEYEELAGRNEHAQTVRSLFLENLQKQLAKLRKLKKKGL